jgi:hypothetical protein
MTLASELDEIAADISIVAPDQARRLRDCATRVRRMQATLAEIVVDAHGMVDATDAVIYAMNRKLGVHLGGCPDQNRMGR